MRHPLAALLAAAALWSTLTIPDAAADSLAVAAAHARRPIVGFEVRGPSKLTTRTLAYLAHVETGDLVGPADLPRLEQDLISSDLFEKVAVALVEAPGGYRVVATLDDKHSWVIAPTAFALPGKKAFGVGFGENNFRGQNQKILLYGQYGDSESLFFGTYLDPSVRGSKWTARYDVFLYQRYVSEYLNLDSQATREDVMRRSTASYLGAGALIGYRFRWWLSQDVRVRGAYVFFRDATDGVEESDDGGPGPTTLPVPQTDGWDISVQSRTTIDARRHRYGVTWGPFLQLTFDKTVPGLDDYGYALALFRAYYSWRLFGEHQLELRSNFGVGHHLPFHEELTLGGASDLRGYAYERFRGDTRAFGRFEYSVPLAKWRFFSFRAITFFDSGYLGYHFNRPGGDRFYFDTQRNGSSIWRNDVGVGIRLYVGAIVLPLLGLDLAYGIEGKSPEVYFELGLTDF